MRDASRVLPFLDGLHSHESYERIANEGSAVDSTWESKSFFFLPIDAVSEYIERRLVDNSSIGDAEPDSTALSIRPKVQLLFLLPNL